MSDTSAEWVTLTVSHAPLLDEITSALRDAGIEVRLSSVERELPQTGVRTRFGARHADDQWIEVRSADLDRASQVVDTVFRDAEEAAYRAAGASLPSEAERAEEDAWRAELAEKQRRSDRRWMRAFQLFFVLILVAVGYAFIAR
jgi:hypothetical protein